MPVIGGSSLLSGGEGRWSGELMTAGIQPNYLKAGGKMVQGLINGGKGA